MSFELAGQYTRKFDQANRVAIPSELREGLGNTVFVLKAIYGEKCLVLYSAEEWENFSRDFVDAYSGAMQATAQRKLSNRVDKVTVDKSGRILLKDDYKAFANLTDEVYISGVMNRVELWNYSNWEEWNAEVDASDDFTFAHVSYTGKRR